jgi:hypothetical protein
VSFQGIVQLPVDLLVAEDAFGRRFRGRLASGQFEMTFPVVGEHSDDWHFMAAPPGAEGMTDLMLAPQEWGRAGFAKSTGPRPLASWVQTIVLTVRTSLRRVVERGGWVAQCLDWSSLVA